MNNNEIKYLESGKTRVCHKRLKDLEGVVGKTSKDGCLVKWDNLSYGYDHYCRYEDLCIAPKRYADDEDPKQEDYVSYKIIVPTEKDRQELMRAFENLHDNISTDTNIIAVNQLVHEYLTEERELGYTNNIITNKQLFDKI